MDVELYKAGTPYFTQSRCSCFDNGCEGHWGTTDNFVTNFLHFSLFSTALWDLVNSTPVHSLMLSSHLFLSALSSSPFHCALQDGFQIRIRFGIPHT